MGESMVGDELNRAKDHGRRRREKLNKNAASTVNSAAQ